jgi:hypothetical protein
MLIEDGRENGVSTDSADSRIHESAARLSDAIALENSKGPLTYRWQANSLTSRIIRNEEPLAQVLEGAESDERRIDLLLNRRAGIEVLAALITINPASLAKASRVDYLRALEKQSSWLQAITQDAIVAVAGAEASEAQDRFSGVDEVEREDISSALRLSTVTAQGRIDTARTLTQDLKNTAAALSAGEISSQHATVIARESSEAIRRGLAPEKLQALENAALTFSEFHTPAQVGFKIRHLIAAMSPQEFELAAVAATEGRKVFLAPESNGMATITAYLAATDAQVVMMAIEKIAKSARINLPGEKLDGLRADALVYMAKEVFRVKEEPPTSGARSTSFKTGPGVSVTDDGSTFSSSDANSKYGNSLSETLTQPSKPIAEDRHHRRLAMLNITLDLQTFLGLADNPGHLESYGSIPSSLARELAGDAKWRRFITQPLTGELLDVGRESYLPSQHLVDFIRARDRTCRFPGCRQPGGRADIDHATSWETGGETNRSNLGLLCRRHHRMKTHQGWDLESYPDGSCLWKSPEGTKYFVPMRSIHEMV